MTACNTWKTPESTADVRPAIFPDYTEITVPVNVAPLNFMVDDAGHVQATFCHAGNELLKVKGKDGVIQIPIRKWSEMLQSVASGNIDVQVSVWDAENPDGKAYLSFPIHVVPDEIDPWISYRLIEPGYVGWRQLGIYQRNMSSFEESVIVSNRASNTTCLNCHNYPAYSPESMMFHARGKNGGTILYDKGKDGVETCRTCNGTGQVRTVQRTPFGSMQSQRPCSACKGTGKIIKDPCSN